MEIPAKAIIQGISFCITTGWAIYSARLLSVGGKGSLETSWKNLAIGAITTAAGILILTVDDLIQDPFLDVLGSAIVALGGVFMLLAIRRQYAVWKSAFASLEPKRNLTNPAETSIEQESRITRASPSAFHPMTLGGVNRRVLIEFGQASDYGRHLIGFLSRMSRGGRRIVLFTKQGSSLSTAPDVKIVLLSFANEGLNVSPDGHMSVFIGNPSLILDAFASVLNDNPEAFVTLDTLTDIVLSIGSSKTHSLLWQMNELMEKEGLNASLLLLLNPKVHDEETCSFIEGFADAIFYCDGDGFHPKKGNLKAL